MGRSLPRWGFERAEGIHQSGQTREQGRIPVAVRSTTTRSSRVGRQCRRRRGGERVSASDPGVSSRVRRVDRMSVPPGGTDHSIGARARESTVAEDRSAERVRRLVAAGQSGGGQRRAGPRSEPFTDTPRTPPASAVGGRSSKAAEAAPHRRGDTGPARKRWCPFMMGTPTGRGLRTRSRGPRSRTASRRIAIRVDSGRQKYSTPGERVPGRRRREFPGPGRPANRRSAGPAREVARDWWWRGPGS